MKPAPIVTPAIRFRSSRAFAIRSAFFMLIVSLAAAGCRDDGPDNDRPRQPATVDLPTPAFPTITDSLLAAGPHGDWPAPGGGLRNEGFSPLTQINAGNIQELVPVWMYSTGIEGAMETSPVVVGNTLYATTAGGRVLALNAATGEELWTYDPAPQTVTLCCGPINRGVSVWGDMVYVASLDARLLALHARSGELAWEAELGDPADGYSAVMAPLAVDGRVFVGVAGQQYGVRGFVAAFDARNGEELWRWHTVPSPEEGGWFGEWRETDLFGTALDRDIGEERQRAEAAGDAWRWGGGGVSTTPAYDIRSGRLFVNVDGPAPLMDPDARPGDNLYTGSIVALDASSGQRVWHAQYLPGDAWGLSGGSPPILFDRQGDTFVAFAGRTGWVYVFRADSGQPVLRSDNFVPQIGLFSRPGSDEGTMTAPGLNGGNAGNPVAHDTRSGTLFVGGIHQPMVYSTESQVRTRGTLWLGGAARFPPDQEQWGTVSAIDLADGHIRWQRRTPGPVHSGVLATAGDLVLVGQGTGTLDAFHAGDGRLLWQFNTGAGVHGTPVTYSVAGVQFIVVASGGSHYFDTTPGDDLIAFALASRRPPTAVSAYPAADYRRMGPAIGGQDTTPAAPAAPVDTPAPPPADTPGPEPAPDQPPDQPLGVDAPPPGR